MNVSPVRQPSALIPIGMSIAAFLTVLHQVVMFGIARQTDEGAAAHIWQLLMAGQIPVVMFMPSSGYRGLRERRCRSSQCKSVQHLQHLLPSIGSGGNCWYHLHCAGGRDLISRNRSSIESFTRDKRRSI